MAGEWRMHRSRGDMRNMRRRERKKERERGRGEPERERERERERGERLDRGVRSLGVYERQARSPVLCPG